jgi:beta-barrel assembly-enhancing protease
MSLQASIPAGIKYTSRGLAVFVGLMLGALTDSGSSLAAGSCYGELQNAQAMRQRIEREWPLRSSGDPLTRYLQRLAERLAQGIAGGNRFDWSVMVARNLAANAFSIGNGTMVVTEGVFSLADNESEIAAVLAHEMGHELSGHFCASASSGSDDWFGVFSSRSVRRQGVGSLVQELDPAKEIQADRVGVAILRATGYEPGAMLNVARRLHVDGSAASAGESRILALEQILGGQPSAAPRDSAEFHTIKRMVAQQQGVR